MKSKGEKESYKHLNAEFQRIARRDKKAFLRAYLVPYKNLYAGQEETVKTKHGTTDWFQIGKGIQYIKAVYCCHLFLISSASVRSLTFLYFIETIFA